MRTLDDSWSAIASGRTRRQLFADIAQLISLAFGALTRFLVACKRPVSTALERREYKLLARFERVFAVDCRACRGPKNDVVYFQTLLPVVNVPIGAHRHAI